VEVKRGVGSLGLRCACEQARGKRRAQLDGAAASVKFPLASQRRHRCHLTWLLQVKEVR